MKRNWLIILVVISLLAALFFIEMSKVKSGGNSSMPTLDNLETDETSKNWEPFYKLRATLIDGQSANFSISEEINGHSAALILNKDKN